MIKIMHNNSNFLSHHGVLGQKWGVRRYQNEDGSLTPEGEKRYGEVVKKAKETSNLIDDWQITDAGLKEGNAQEALNKANAAQEDFHKLWKQMSDDDQRIARDIVENMIYKDDSFGTMILYWDPDDKDYYVIAR